MFNNIEILVAGSILIIVVTALAEILLRKC